jgi:NADH-quinone oxidoreductase subunit G
VPPGEGESVLATWTELLDAGRLQDDEPYLAGTARSVVARVSAGTAALHGLTDGGGVVVSTDAGAVTAPVLVTDMPDGVVWLPTNAVGSPVRRALRTGQGGTVRLAPWTADIAPGGPR